MKVTLIIILLLLSTLSTAEIYKWIDKNGKIHYSDSIQRAADSDVETIGLKINTYTNVTYTIAKTKNQAKSSKVVMYSAPWCGYCKKAKRYFVENKIPFIEYDIENDSRAKQRHKKMGATGVPVILYKGKRMNGFSAAGFKRFYKS